MATHHGKEGVVTAGGTGIGELTGFTLETTGDVVEDTALTDEPELNAEEEKRFQNRFELAQRKFQEAFTQLADMKVGEISEFFSYNNRKAFFILNDILPARKMTFEEAFNRLLSDYQPIREENWLQRLRDKYQIQAFPAVIDEQFTTVNVN